MKGYVHSLQSLGTVDGPGVRAVVFSEGCPLLCIYCHNPDTWEKDDAHLCEAQDIVGRIKRLYPYIKDGGVTFSGGEPCAQAEFFSELARLIKMDAGLHIALDTSGAIYNEKVEELLSLCDLVLLDIKMTNEDDYKKYTRGSLSATLAFLQRLEDMGKDVWIRHVLLPDINDTPEKMRELLAITHAFSCVKKVEFLPFKNLCLEKYQALGIEFPMKNIPSMPQSRFDALIKEIG
jgi:pyruvate formate lyase activating enzyme